MSTSRAGRYEQRRRSALLRIREEDRAQVGRLFLVDDTLIE
jgi:hypothetical protein